MSIVHYGHCKEQSALHTPKIRSHRLFIAISVSLNDRNRSCNRLDGVVILGLKEWSNLGGERYRRTTSAVTQHGEKHTRLTFDFVTLLLELLRGRGYRIFDLSKVRIDSGGLLVSLGGCFLLFPARKSVNRPGSVDYKHLREGLVNVALHGRGLSFYCCEFQ